MTSVTCIAVFQRKYITLKGQLPCNVDASIIRL